ncbi:DUF6193 family natural product biosynthesis protein [Kitasatospora sp. NPDC051853]|uniref:DUF6193 family natural product biosynthesis protein n=1 Tax=Kitasatospora sp. NPDC051853 TaxID=3364058 RepID=UPI0037A4267E
MPPEPNPAVLYPDVAAYGSLAAALRALADADGTVLDLTASSVDPLRQASATGVHAHRKSLAVSAHPTERRWSVTAFGNNGLLLSGSTDDLGHLPPVIEAWVSGAPLEAVAESARFDVLSGRPEVVDGTAADVIAAEWAWILRQARDADWPEHLALVEAAHAEPRLRELYPFTSHWALSFAAGPDAPPDAPPFLSLQAPHGTPPYTVRESWNGPVLARVDGPAAAVAFAVARLPGWRTLVSLL